MKAILAIVFASAIAVCLGDGAESSSALKERNEEGLRKLAERQAAHREILSREYIGRLRRFERMARWRRTRANEAAVERKRFELEQIPARRQFSADPEVARLQAILAGAYEPLERQLRESTYAVANAYLFRLASQRGAEAAASERRRIARQNGLPPGTDGSTDLAASEFGRIEVFADRAGESGLRFDLRGLPEDFELSDARLRVACISVADGDGEHLLAGAGGQEIASWKAPGEQFSIVLIDLTADFAAALDEGRAEVQLELAPPGVYAPPGHGSPTLEPRLLVNDAAAAMAPRDTESALPQVEVFQPLSVAPLPLP